MERFKITCKSCGATREIGIRHTAFGERVDWLEDDPKEKIVSARQRLDGQWGFQCLCGSNDLLTQQEANGIENKVSPDPQQVKDILENLVPQKMLFKLEAL